MKQPNGLRFESREIAVILSLFIFVSLLMFTVGIVIGKGLAQAKFEGEYQSALPPKEASQRSPSSQTSQTPASQIHTSSSVSINSPFTEEETKSEEMKPREEYKPLELQPKTKEPLALREEGENKETDLETESLLNNPMIRDLFEEKKPAVAQKKSDKKRNRDFAIEKDFSHLQAAQPESKRSTASMSVPPPSLATGPYSVQIAAYSDKTQAEERVEALKKIGYPHAYFSSVYLGENKETWFRVWLGYYPSFESAKLGGTALQARGEVKNFLVRKTQKTGSTD